MTDEKNYPNEFDFPEEDDGYEDDETSEALEDSLADEPFETDVAEAEADVYDDAPTSSADGYDEADAGDIPPETDYYIPQESTWELNIDEALAAVASVSDDDLPSVADPLPYQPELRTYPVSVNMALPPMTQLKRGSLGSFIPGVLLIGAGAFLTYLTTTHTPIDPVWIVLGVLGGGVLTLLAQWLGSRRFGFGYLFFSLVVLSVVGVTVFALLPNGLPINQSFPLLFGGVGLSIILASVLSRHINRQFVIVGLLLIVLGVAGLLITTAFVPATLVQTVVNATPILAGVVLVLWALPLVTRLRAAR